MGIRFCCPFMFVQEKWWSQRAAAPGGKKKEGEYLGSHKKKCGWSPSLKHVSCHPGDDRLTSWRFAFPNYILQVIQRYSKWPSYPLVGGHLTFSKGHLTIQNVTKNCQTVAVSWIVFYGCGSAKISATLYVVWDSHLVTYIAGKS